MTEQQIDRVRLSDHDRMNYWWRRATQAEARIKAVQDALDVDEHVTKQMGTLGQWRPDVPAITHDTIRRALDG